MRKLGIAALTALTLAAFGFGAPTKEALSEPLLDEDFVNQLMAGGPTAPDAAIRVTFGRHAAIYRWSATNPTSRPGSTSWRKV
jgi:hypothetical protein